MRRRRMLTTTGAVVAGAVVAGAVLAGASGASPRNDNTRTETIECTEPLGKVTLTIMDPPSRADREGDDDHGRVRTAFTSDGRTVVLKAEESSFEGTATVAGEAPVPFAGSEGASWGAHGAGVSRQLVECGGSGTFTDRFVVDDAVAQELNQLVPAPFDWTDHIGDEVSMSGTFTFTVLVMVPR